MFKVIVNRRNYITLRNSNIKCKSLIIEKNIINFLYIKNYFLNYIFNFDKLILSIFLPFIGK